MSCLNGRQTCAERVSQFFFRIHFVLLLKSMTSETDTCRFSWFNPCFIHAFNSSNPCWIHVESMLNPCLITVFWSFPDRLPFLKLSDQRPEDVATLSQALAERDQDAWRFFSKWISANELKTGLWNLRLFFPQNCRGILPTHHLLKSYECRIKMIYLCNLQNMIEPL